MNKAQQLKYDALYQQHINALRRQGKAATTIDVYVRALRRITGLYDLCPDRLSQEHLKEYLAQLRYQTFILTAYSMGLRLGEVLNSHPHSHSPNAEERK